MKIVKILAALAVIFVVLVFFKNTIVQSALGAAISKIARVPVSIGRTDVRLLASYINLGNIKVYNPHGFPERLMLDAPQILIDFDPGPLWKGQAHFQEVRLNVKEIVVIKNRQGKLNINAMKPTQEENRRQMEKKEKQKQGAGKAPRIQIDKFYLTIGRVVYKDYTAGTNPSIQEFNINIQDRLYTNIDNPAGIASLIMFEALTRTTLSKLGDLDIGLFKDGATGAFNEGMGLLGGGADKIEETAKGLLNIFR